MSRLTILAAVLLAAALTGCVKRAESTQQVNGEFAVDTLFVKDGCTVYRFYDGTAARYFTNCRGTATWRESCGKNCIRDQAIPGGAPHTND